MVVRPGPRGHRPPLNAAVAAAYGASAATWDRGPGRIYARLADAVLDAGGGCGRLWDGASVVDLGAGTGAAGLAALRRGASVVAVDAALGMLAHGAAGRPPAAAGDAIALPFRSGSFDVAVAAFSLNHLDDPVAGLREAGRVVRPDGRIVASAYAADDSHPAMDVVNRVAEARGWSSPSWLEEIRGGAATRLATAERASAAAGSAGLRDVAASVVRVEFPDLTARELVAWRLGMAQLADFVAGLDPGDAEAMAADACALLEGCPPLVRSMVVVSGRVP